MSLLKHLRVLDFSTLLPGPFGTMMLADLGADVVHITKPSQTPHWSADDYLQRSKKSIVADLKDPETVSKVRGLVKDFDIIIEQFRPGVMDRLGLGYEELKKVNSSIIYCSITGYGQTGPYKDRPGHDINYVSIAGLAGHSGTLAEGPPNLGFQVADIAGGSLHAVIGILASVIHRERTGEGQMLDISMSDCSFTFNALSAQDFFENGIDPKPEGTMLNGGSFYGFYETRDGRYVSVGSLEPKFCQQLCTAVGREELFAISYSLNPDHVRKVKEGFREAFKSKTLKEWNQIFANIEGCVEPVLTFEEAVNHPQIVARNMVVEVPTPDGGVQRQIANPIKSTAFKPVYKHIGLRPGSNNDEILGGVTSNDSV
jgi:alpha-methylacyl-CoA racemase